MTFFSIGFDHPNIFNLHKDSEKEYKFHIVSRNLGFFYKKFFLIGEKYKRIKIAPLIKPPI